MLFTLCLITIPYAIVGLEKRENARINDHAADDDRKEYFDANKERDLWANGEPAPLASFFYGLYAWGGGAPETHAVPQHRRGPAP